MVFLSLWAGVAFLIEWLDQRRQPSMVERLWPYVDRGEDYWVSDVEDWLRRY
ncbi:MAG TPA: hypothetical protein VM142_13475 [Acidimicrobiales bacterium]|nr:hypothetical protein [Acidimicrobiales bacterium]